jgi:cellulose synthase/poly-beta-1,6-N-acetylglucosamine synthase-like glycosyltransferase
MSTVIPIAGAVFWVSLGLIVYTYFVYPVILFGCYALAQLKTDLRYLLRRLGRRVVALDEGQLPGVTFVIPAYNEEKHLRQKIANLGALDYPRDRLQVIIVSDGSTDSTNEILAAISESHFEIVKLAKRGGKASSLNEGVSRARYDVLAFSDASTLFAPDTVRKLVRHFGDRTVGVVCGALRFHASAESQQTEGIYWTYESMIRLMEGRLGATLTASGAVYALRREAYIPLAPGTVLDDFITPMNARKQGYRVIYDPEAVAFDFAASSVKGEFSRRVRLAAGSFRSLGELLRAPLPGFTRFAFFSHKLIRWIVPLLLLAVLFANILLLGRHFYQALFLLQMAFYGWAAAGFLFQEQMRRIRFGVVGYFLLSMNLAFLVGLYRCLIGRKEAMWQRVS